ncbi:ubiquitin carboxyl-hydrolase [Salmonella enterica]
MATEKKNVGRPSDYLPEVADDICALLASGESLVKVCKRPGMPAKATVFRWLSEHEEFRDKYAKATEARADSIFEEIFEIADNAIPDAAEVAKARLRVDTRKWALARMNPRKYGDKVTNELVGKDGGAIQTITMSKEEYKSARQEMMEDDDC